MFRAWLLVAAVDRVEGAGVLQGAYAAYGVALSEQGMKAGVVRNEWTERLFAQALLAGEDVSLPAEHVLLSFLACSSALAF
jgi:hypothetical protein